METHNLNLKKLEACIKLGRRFYVVSKLLMNYMDKILKSPIRNAYRYYINKFNAGDVLLVFSEERRDEFNPIYSVYEVLSYPRSSCYEIYRLFSDEVYINFYTRINAEEFNRRYTHLYEDEYLTIFRKLKDIHINQIPIEVNLRLSEIKSDDGQILFTKRSLLIELLYFSSNIFKFFNNFTSYLLLSTSFYHGLVYRFMGKSIGLPGYYNTIGDEKPGVKLMKIFYKGRDEDETP